MNVDKMFQTNEKEKKRMYNHPVFQIKNGSFSPMVFAANGTMGIECHADVIGIAELNSVKKVIPKSVLTNFTSTNISFSLSRTMLTSVRGS